MAMSDSEHYYIPPDELQISNKVLGDGVYACVYEATWNGASVAVKCIHERIKQRAREIAEDRAAEALEKLRKELVVMVRIHHPNIVQLFGVYAPNSRNAAIVMELMQMSLYERALKREPRIEPRLSDVNVTDILRDMSAALAYLHSRNIIHRDISPKNTLLYDDARQGRLVAKLSDFAGSKILHEIDYELLSSLSGMVGTQPYLPWEAIEKDDATRNVKYNTSVDVYGVGAVGLAALLGEDPGATPKYKPRFLKRLGEGHLLYDILSECLDDTPGKRPSSALLRARLEKLQHSAPYCEKKEHDRQVQQAHNAELQQQSSKVDMPAVEWSLSIAGDRIQMLEKELETTQKQLAIAKQTSLTAAESQPSTKTSTKGVLSEWLEVLADPVGQFLRRLAAFCNTATFVTSLTENNIITEEDCIEADENSGLTETSSRLAAAPTVATMVAVDQQPSDIKERFHKMKKAQESAEERAFVAEERVRSLEQQLEAAQRSQAVSWHTLTGGQRSLRSNKVPAERDSCTMMQPPTASKQAAAAPTSSFKNYPYRLLSPIPDDGKRNHKSVCVGQWIVQLSGYNKMGKFCQRVFAYDTLMEKWEEWPPAPYAYCAAASDGEHLYIAGGRTSQSTTTKVFYLSADRRKWKELPEMLHGVFFCSAAYHKRKLYIFSGSQSLPGILQLFDFREQKWSIAKAAPRELQPIECSGVLLPWGDKLVTDQFAYYDTKRDKWHRLPQREAGVTAALGVINGELIAVGVHFEGGEFAVDSLLSVQSAWLSLGSLPTKRRGAAVCAKENVLYVTGGHHTENIAECIWQQ